MAVTVSIQSAAVLMLLMFAISHANHGESRARETLPVPLSTVVQMINGFSATLYQALKDSKGNLQVLPLNMGSLLTLLCLGSKGPSSTDIRTIMKFTSTDADLTNGFHMLYSALNASHYDSQLYANKIYMDKSFEINAQFQNMSENNFMTPMESLDFLHDLYKSTGKVVTWLEKQTNYRVSLPLGSLERGSEILMIPAVTSYLQVSWERQYFKKEDMRWGLFYPMTGRAKPARFMHCAATFRFAEVKDMGAKMLELPVAGGLLVMWIILPVERNGLPALEQNIQNLDLSKLPRIAYQNVMVSLPRFQVHNSFKLKVALKKVGLASLFSQDADFSNISTVENGLKVTNIIQRSFLEITEQGDSGKEAQPSRKSGEKEFKVDHPFMFVVQDVNLGMNMIIGRVNDIN